MAALRRPAGPAYSLLRERPGGNVVVGIYRICTPRDHRICHGTEFFICDLKKKRQKAPVCRN